MEVKSAKILVTRELSGEQIKFAEGLGLQVTIEPAINIEFRDDWFALETILKNLEKPVFAFTSRNGVEAFSRFKSAGTKFPDDIRVYAVGKKTAEALISFGLNPIVAKQQDGVGLAKKITDDFLSERDLKNATVLHFCGDKRRDEFRQFLEQSEIKVRDMVVYKTILKPMNLPDFQPDAILFYSPSAVQAYRESGGFVTKNPSELFAIGSTTAEELSIESGKHVHISPEPDTETFLKFVKGILDEA
ncbi:MAG: uroporphyrinogen-III synthase [Balneolaceae bacterium]|nr:MAG: uroporphyrinogen-III synthase [Balneolaceae bacterium]